MDILEHAAIKMQCQACGETSEVSLRQVVLSQEMMRNGCPITRQTECPPLAYANLADTGQLRDLERAWSRLTEVVRGAGGDLVLWR